MLAFVVPRARPVACVARYVVVAVVAVVLVGNLYLWQSGRRVIKPPLKFIDDTHEFLRNYQPLSAGAHPIAKLMSDATAAQDRLLASASTNVSDAAARYREKRGRHPPPGFDEWFQAAKACDAVVVEDFFDRIYKDLTPFWALDPDTITARANSWHWAVKVRNGQASAYGNVEGRIPWLQFWTDQVAQFAQNLPDVSMPINYHDEPRLLVPHDKMSEMVAKEQEQRSMPAASEVSSNYRTLEEFDARELKPYDPIWSGPDKSYWSLAVKTCGPETAAYQVGPLLNLSTRVQFPKAWHPDYAYRGFIRNWTASMDACQQPHLRQLHGTFLEPISLTSAEELIPLFGGSKLPMNSEILIPGAMYFSNNPYYTGGSYHGPAWQQKTTGIVWRGNTDGGRFRHSSWRHFHRLRFVDMMNGTTLSHAEIRGKQPETFELPDVEVYNNKHQASGRLGVWITNFANVGFGFICPPHQCEFLAQNYQTVRDVNMDRQLQFKFIPDIDGDAYSGRFLGFMQSTSVPMKATVFTEWYDDRIQPWLHFVPLDNSFQDLYSVLEFFGDVNGPGDDAARYIATVGKMWAEKVLRQQDMRLYMWRLLLEWARVCDTNRDTLGYVDDLLRQS